MGRLGRLDSGEAGLAHRNQALDDPVDVLLYRHDHIRQH